MNHFKKGDVIYVPSANWTALPKPCPVCNGTTRILVKALGAPDEQGHDMFCEYCRWAERDGYKRGHVVEDWDWMPKVQRVVIEGVEQVDRPGRREVKYLYNCTSCSWNSVNHEDVFTDEAAAMKAAEAMRLSAQQQQQPKCERPNPSYKSGYCREQIKKARAEAEKWEKALSN